MFSVPAQAYGRFMGRYSEPLADRLMEILQPRPGVVVADVGCGPGMVSARLAPRVGAASVHAFDPSGPFVAAAAERLPGVDVRQAGAEDLPLADQSVDLYIAQLVLPFVTDRAATMAEAIRIVRPGGLIAASVWDSGGGRSPLDPFWSVVHELDPGAPSDSDLFGTVSGQLADLFEASGLVDVRQQDMTVEITIAGAQEWWEPYTLGVGPPGQYVAGLDDAARDRLRDACLARLPDGPITARASAWLATGKVAAA